MFHSELLVKMPQPWVQAGSGQKVAALAPDILSEPLTEGQCITEHPQETPAPHNKDFLGNTKSTAHNMYFWPRISRCI